MADPQQHETELQLFLQFLDDNPYLRALLHTLDASEETDFERWKDDLSCWVSFPPSETARAKLCLSILKECGSGQSRSWIHRFGGKQMDEMLNNLNDAVLDPLVNYLYDRIDDTGNVLYLLQRFKRKAEWFKQQELYQQYNHRTRSGEKTLDRVLREALFDGGVDYPFSQPDSPSGQADIVSLDDTNDPLVLETKVFDPARSKGKSHLRQGFHQVLRYANDYQQNVGYLVAFNCSGNQLVWPSENSADGEFPPRIVHDGKTFFLIAIDIGTDRESASKETPTGRTVISRADLTVHDDGG